MNNRSLEEINHIISKKGYTAIRMINEGGHGKCFIVSDSGGNRYILKSFRHNSMEECRHEMEVAAGIHFGLGSDRSFKYNELRLRTDNGYEYFLLSTTSNGQTLREYRQGSFVSLKRATALMADAALSISLMHSESKCDAGFDGELDSGREKDVWIHCDIKPSNLYLIKDPDENKEKVIPIDYGSAVRKGKKKYREIIKSTGYSSTREYASARLLSFLNELEYSFCDKSQEARIEELESHIGEREDIFSLVCTYFYMITGEDFHEISKNEFSPIAIENAIKSALQRADVPFYLTDRLTGLFTKLIAPSSKNDAEIDIGSVDELIDELNTVLEIEENKGFHPEVMLKNSRKYFEDNVAKYLTKDNFDENLLTEIKILKNYNGEK